MNKYILLMLIILGFIAYNSYVNASPIPQFTEEQMQIICVQEEI